MNRTTSTPSISTHRSRWRWRSDDAFCRSIVADLWHDERAAVSPISVVLTTTILTLGAIVGLTTLRDHITQQYGDVAVALRNVRQSYDYTVGVDVNRDGDIDDPEDCVMSGHFSDRVDIEDAAGAAPACLDLTIAPISEF